MKHTATLLLVMALLGLQAKAQAQESSLLLVIEDTSGQTFAYSFNEKPIVTCSGGVFQMKSDANLYETSLDGVARFYFADPSGVNTPGRSVAPILFKQTAPNYYVVTGLGEKDVVTVYDAAGRRLSAGGKASKGRAVVDLGKNAPGVYVIQVGNKQTLKLIKQ